MNCQEVDQSLAAYLHGEVGRSERELIRAHIAQCPRCQAELSRLTELQNDVSRSLHAAADSATPSPAAWARLQASLAPQRQPTLADRVRQTLGGGIANRVAPRTLMFLASAVIVSAVALGLVVWPRPRTELQPQPVHDAVATPVPAVAPVVAPDAPPESDHARRISGPIDESSLLPQPMTDKPAPASAPASAPAAVLVAPESDAPVASASTSTGVGGWIFVQTSSQEGAPYRVCTNCTPFE